MKPTKIYLIRHGQSAGNVDKELYKSVPDYALNLTPEGEQQAIATGKQLKALVGDATVACYYSPFFRTRRTADLILNEFTTTKIQFIPRYITEDARLREQEWCGKLREDGFMHEAEAERDVFGHFYYRFSGGESCADVYDRVSSFFNTLHRDFNKADFPRHCFIVTHGMTMRLIIMRWFHLDVEDFESLANPKNCEIWTMARSNQFKKSRYILETQLRRYETPRCQFRYPFSKEESITRETATKLTI